MISVILYAIYAFWALKQQPCILVALNSTSLVFCISTDLLTCQHLTNSKIQRRQKLHVGIDILSNVITIYRIL